MVKIRLMDETDLSTVPEVKESYEKHFKSGDYFFFIIEENNPDSLENSVIGFITAKRNGRKIKGNKKFIMELGNKKWIYGKEVELKFFEYLDKLFDFDGTHSVYQISVS